MEFKDVLTYCPKCKSLLDKNDNRHFVCSSCHFSLYINPAPCNAAIVTDKDNRILLVRRKFEPKKNFWDLPGGFIEFGENVEDSLRRELHEELGIEIGDIRYISSFPDRYLFGELNYHTLGLVYAAKYAGQKMIANDDITEIHFFKPEEVPFEMIAFPSVTKAIKMFMSLSPLH